MNKKEADLTTRPKTRLILFDRWYVEQATITCQSIHATRKAQGCEVTIKRLFVVAYLR